MIKYFENKYALSEEGAKDFVISVVWTALMNLSLMAPVVIGMTFLEMLVDDITGKQEGIAFSTLQYGVAFVLAFALMLLIAYKQYDTTYTKIYNESAKRRINLAETLRKLPLAFFGKKDIADLSSTIMEDATQIEQLFSHAVPQIYGAVISVLLMGIGLFAYQWELALATFWVIPLSAGVFALSRKFQKKTHRKMYFIKREISDEIQESLDLAQEIKSYNRETETIKHIGKLLDNEEKAMVKDEMLIGAFVNLSYVFLKLGLPSVILTGLYMYSNAKISLFTYIVFLIVASRIYHPIMDVMNHMATLLYLDVRIERMKEMDAMPCQEGANKFNPTSFDISFDHVRFSYDDGTEIIKDISFTAKQGQVTALVGPSGGGKSTIAKLAARFWDINSGKIYLGGQDISKIDPETLLKYYSIVFQDVTLFNTSVMENIRLGRKEATDQEVMNAAKMARCDEFIKKLSDGYKTRIGENGEKLSGGERQRISIARAILKDTPIILLDEATASLDAENETQIQEALGELIKNKTVLIIAHRMRTVLGADKIVVIADGKIEQEDHPSVLSKKAGIFSTMLKRQYQGG